VPISAQDTIPLFLDIVQWSSRIGRGVKEVSVTWDALRSSADAPAALLNWNQQHWTVLQKRGTQWVHTNSVLGNAMHNGRMWFTEDLVAELLSCIRRDYGSVSLYQLEAADPTLGFVHLERDGLRAMVGQGEEEPEAHAAQVPGDDVTHLRIVSLNADGCGSYRMSTTERINAMVDNLLTLDPDIIALQEVTDDMHAAVKGRLGGWSIYRRRSTTENYFVVTAVRALRAAASDKCTSYAFPDSQDGRHVLVVRRGQWALANVHAESGSRARQRDAREKQMMYLSRLHEAEAEKAHVLIGDMNLRDGEDQWLRREGWVEAAVLPCTLARGCEPLLDWTWKRGANAARYDRVYTHSPVGTSVVCTAAGMLKGGVWSTLTDHVVLCVDLSCSGEESESRRHRHHPQITTSVRDRRD
jgi:endonuclease/exonuclease/phosphatase family metal-dependent hydrolase